jgi:hypothetical protein
LFRSSHAQQLHRSALLVSVLQHHRSAVWSQNWQWPVRCHLAPVTWPTQLASFLVGTGSYISQQLSCSCHSRAVVLCYRLTGACLCCYACLLQIFVCAAHCHPNKRISRALFCLQQPCPTWLVCCAECISAVVPVIFPSRVCPAHSALRCCVLGTDS